MKIRKARQDDAEELIKTIQIADNRIEEEARRKINKYMTSDKGFFILAVEGSKVLGYLLFKIRNDDMKANQYINIEDYCCVNWIAVHPDKRNMKIGSRLLKEGIKYSSKYKKKGLWLDCRESVVGFYEKNDFKIKGEYMKKDRSDNIKSCYVLIKESM